MGIDPIDASNACIPPTHPLTHQALPLPSTTRGEPLPLDGNGGRLNANDPAKRPVLMYPSGKLVVVREIDIDGYEYEDDHPDQPNVTYAPSKTHASPTSPPQTPAPSTSGFLYRGHASPVTALRFHPAGTYVASGDSRGKLRVWAFDHEEHLPKLEYSAFAGPARDVAWDGEGKRLVVVGEGVQGAESGKAIQWDTGVSCGELGQHARKKGASCAVRPTRPMRVATGGMEDATVMFHKGPPFQRVVGEEEVGRSERRHERGAVHGLRYNADGSRLASVGTDGSVCFYDGKGMVLERRVERVHRSSVFGCAWNDGGTHLLTCGADGFARLLEGSSGEMVCEWNVAEIQGEDRNRECSGEDGNLHQETSSPDVNEKVPMGAMQLGCAFVKGEIPVSVGFNGQITVLPIPASLNLPFASKASTLEKPLIITGHQAPIAAMTLGAPGTNTIYTADTDGVIVQWNGNTGKPKGRVRVVDQADTDILGKVHGGATISSLSFCESEEGGGTLYSAGWDDHLRITRGTHCVDKLPLEAQPNAISTGSALAVVMTVEGLLLVQNRKIVSELFRLPYHATAICLSRDDATLYVGGDDGNIYVYSVHSSDAVNPLVETHVLRETHGQPVQSLRLSNDGTKLASSDVRDVCIHSTDDYSPIVSKGRWCFHTQSIRCLAWSPDDTILASGGNDDDIFLWSWEKKMKRIHYRFAHRGGVTGLEFVGKKNDPSGRGEWILVSTGNDGCLNWWNVEEDVRKKFK